MKTSFCIAAGLTVAAAQVVTKQQAITMFNPEDFAFSLGGPDPSNSVNGFQIRGVNVNQLPALEGYGISMALVNLDACAINLPHLHPRATEMSYVIEGDIRVAFVEENGGEGAVVNDLAMGDVAFFPQGLIHYQQNVGCEPATFLAALSSEDPGAVTITTRFFELPTEAIEAATNFEDPMLQTLIDGLPMAPALARERCLEMCGMTTMASEATMAPETTMDPESTMDSETTIDSETMADDDDSKMTKGGSKMTKDDSKRTKSESSESDDCDDDAASHDH